LAIGTVSLALPSGMILELNNYYYVPAISRNIISISCLDMFGFEFKFKNNGCCFYLNDMYYGKVSLHNGLYILDLNVPVYNIQTKRLKSNDLNPTLLWHCRLGHISEKRIKKLHKEAS
jgi:GAG-pre-integrase domain